MEEHGHGPSFQVRSLGVIAIVLCLSGMELGVGIASGGTVLMQDALHNIIDVVAYGLPALSERWARRTEHGIRRCFIAPQLARASASLLVLSAIGFGIVGISELAAGGKVEISWYLPLVALVAVLGNLLAHLVLHEQAHVEFNENLAASRAHVIGDIGATIWVLATTVALAASNQDYFDGIGTIGAALIVIKANLGAATTKAPVQWHKRKDHPKGR